MSKNNKNNKNNKSNNNNQNKNNNNQNKNNNNNQNKNNNNQNKNNNNQNKNNNNNQNKNNNNQNKNNNNQNNQNKNNNNQNNQNKNNNNQNNQNKNNNNQNNQNKNNNNQNNQNKNQAIKAVAQNVGNKFTKSDFKGLKKAGASANRKLKIAAKTSKVGDKASNKLSRLNPGFQISSTAREKLSRTDANGQGQMALQQLNSRKADQKKERKQLGKQIKGAGKNYLQWQGTTAKGAPLALGGFKIPKGMRKGNALKIGKKAIKKGSFTQNDGSGSYLGRGATDILNKKGKPANKTATWAPGNNAGKGGKGNNKVGVSGGGDSMPSFDTGGSDYGDFGGGGSDYGDFGGGGADTPDMSSSVFGGSGTEVSGSPNFRRRRSRSSKLGIASKGASRLGSNLQRPSGLSIPV
jgi:hypothetical protein